MPGLSLMDVRPCFLLYPALLSAHTFPFPQAKKFVESLPKVLKENVTKEDAEKLQKLFEGIAVVKLE